MWLVPHKWKVSPLMIWSSCKINNVGSVFEMVIWSESRMGLLRDDDHQEDAPHFIIHIIWTSYKSLFQTCRNHWWKNFTWMEVKSLEYLTRDWLQEEVHWWRLVFIVVLSDLYIWLIFMTHYGKIHMKTYKSRKIDYWKGFILIMERSREYQIKASVPWLKTQSGFSIVKVKSENF